MTPAAFRPSRGFTQPEAWPPASRTDTRSPSPVTPHLGTRPVRAAVAGNLGSPLEVLRALAIDEDEAVRAGVAGNAAAGVSTEGPALHGGPAQGEDQVVPGRGRARRLQAPSLELPER